jgi:tRNA A64-2'-O-ribosylphosphate transferase
MHSASYDPGTDIPKTTPNILPQPTNIRAEHNVFVAMSLSTSDIIFPDASHNFSAVLYELKKSTLSIHNRLNSIQTDSTFVTAVASAYKLPLIANERCGSWYIPPHQKAEGAYFKSTDGHMGQWAFSLRRLNIQIFNILEEASGCIIVDSTRRGKSMPDALSKTVPIWCAVWNSVLFPQLLDEARLNTPSDVVSGSEHALIEQRIERFADDLRGLDLNLVQLKNKVKKPLKPIWVTWESILPDEAPHFDHFVPIVLCTASKKVKGTEISEGGYIQGAGDDSEGWSHGLTPPIFWENEELLLRTPEPELPGLIRSLLHSNKIETKNPLKSIKPTSWLQVGTTGEIRDTVIYDRFDLVIDCSKSFDAVLESRYTDRYLHLPCATGKVGTRELKPQLYKIPIFVRHIPLIHNIAVGCPTGKDLSLGVALGLLCIFAGEDGMFLNSEFMDQLYFD